MTGPPAYPRATYRLQLNKDFRFEDARRVVPYLAALGISHVYLSPILMARPGSMHGYDIVDHNRFNPEIGDEREFDDLVATLQGHGMGLILDFVPNHMFVGPDNSWWMDILEWGKSSPFASYVDIDWSPLEPTNIGKVVLPVLGDHYGVVLERGELKLDFDETRGMFAVRYFDNAFPISPRDYPTLLRKAAAISPGAASGIDPLLDDLLDCLRLGRGRARRLSRSDRVTALKTRLSELYKGSPVLRRAVTEALAPFEGEPGKPGTFDALHRLLERQHYRLAFWRVAAHEINYRRFFDINDLVGLRMEQPELFDQSHRLVGRLISEGKVQGMRLDHVDGLRDPKAYLMRLQKLGPKPERKPGAVGPRQPLYALVEKILAPEERVPGDWPVSGTTGYDFMREVNGLFIDPSGERALTRAYERFIGRATDYGEVAEAAKRNVMRQTMASELNVLANAFNRIAKRSRHSRDYTMTGFREALEGIVARFPVYRTYVTASAVTAADRRVISEATDAARRIARTADTTIYDFIRDVLTLDILQTPRGSYPRRAVIDAALKFQQYTGPVMAKAVEDTALYRYVRFVSLNEVGSEPDRFRVAPEAFHAAARERLLRHPFSLLATATHDHKRGEDVRARLDVLSEMPRDWSERVRRWARLNRRQKRWRERGPAPSLNDEYLFYQTVIGAWPLGMAGGDFAGLSAFRDRLRAYMLKAAREAKLDTSWAAPDEAYEEALEAFVGAVLDPDRSQGFLDDVSGFVERVAPAGAVNGLAQTAVKLTVPGVPDTYQGCDYWDLSLVDPDNRRPIDYEARRERLAHLDSLQTLAQAEWLDGSLKQGLIHRILKLRRAHPSLFAVGSYEGLEASGRRARNVLAFARHLDREALVVVVPRLMSADIVEQGTLQGCAWGDTSLTLQPWGGSAALRDILTGRETEVAPDGWLAVGDVFAELPIAVLYGEVAP